MKKINDFGYILSDVYEKNIQKKSIVYTPKEVARNMLALSFRKYFNKENQKEKIKKLKLIDISCGSGNFLVEALEFLIRISKIYYGKYMFFKNWITGYDIDQEALYLANNRLQVILKKYNLNKYEKQMNINCANSLLIDFDKKYDIVIGNPPYIGEKNNKEVFEAIKDTDFGKRYYEGKMDYFYFFIEKGIEILKKDGILTYITTNYWLTADFASKLREKIKKDTQLTHIFNNNKSLFKRAYGQHNIIFSLDKTKDKKDLYIENDEEKFIIESDKVFNHNNKIALISSKNSMFFINLLKKSNYKISDILNVNQGIVSGCDKAFVLNEFNYTFEKYLKPFYKSKDIMKYSVNKEDKRWILYIDRNTIPDQNVLNHLEEYKEKLEKRREVKRGFIDWFQLQWCREETIFNAPKIVGRQRNKINNFAYNESELYGSADIYYLTNKAEHNLYFILGYLNSTVFYEWFFYNGKRKGTNLELYSTPLKETPIIYPDDIDKIKYIEGLVKLQILSFEKEREEKINQFFRGEL